MYPDSKTELTCILEEFIENLVVRSLLVGIFIGVMCALVHMISKRFLHDLLLFLNENKC